MSTTTKLTAAAYADSQIAMIWWDFVQKIPGCLGVQIERIYSDAPDKPELLQTWLPFEGQDNSNWQSRGSDELPVQDCHWKDVQAQKGRKLQYRITPRVGTPGNLTSRDDLAVLTNEVILTQQFGAIKFGRNNGMLVSTQYMARKLGNGPDGKPDYQKLIKAINTPGDPLREELSGDLIPMLKELILRAKNEGGHAYLCLYELSDPEMIQFILDNKDYLSIILGNTGDNDEENAPARAKLHAAGVDIYDRMLKNGHIPHNKSVVYVNAQGVPVAVLYGSTNWTATGICAQSNCSFIIVSEEVARLFFDYWQRIKADGSAQGQTFRLTNANIAAAITMPDGSTVQVGFSPCTKEDLKPKTGAQTPPPLAILFKLMDNTSDLLMQHLFIPGFPSVLSEAVNVMKQKPDLMIRSIVNADQALPREVSSGTQQWPNALFIAAAALEKQVGPELPELLKAGEDAHAITHFKGMTGDPKSKTKCWSNGGSDNLGFKAEYQNDENEVIVVGNQPLCTAQTVFIYDVISHYEPRWLLIHNGGDFTGFLSTSDNWQDKFLAEGPARKELLYWVGPDQD